MNTTDVLIGVIAGVVTLSIILFVIKIIKNKRNKKQSKKIEFSKIVLALVLSTYFLGLYIGYKTVLLDFTQLGTLLAYIGAPTATSIGFYAWKARAENIIKIKKANPEETEGINIDFNNIIP